MTLILDTNVVSELMRPTPEPRVSLWLDGQPLDGLAITAVTVAELLYGLDRLADGRRKSDLQARLETLLRRGFLNRVLPFDHRAAQAYARLKGGRERAGHPMSGYDAMIAAIAIAHGAVIATRNISDFEGCGLTLVNPWDDTSAH